MDRRGERGQTIILVAVALVSLLAMAALAIDVVTLYVARSETQRAADAAALAGAKGLADSGVTTLQPGDANLGAAETMAQSMALAEVIAFLDGTLPTNQVSAGPPSLVTGFPTFNMTPNNNPRITVSIQRINLPTFFARILGRNSATVTATATAEAYNPANVQNFTPITPKGVKPWLVANLDPAQSGNPFVNGATGAVETGVIGENFSLRPDCQAALPTTCTLARSPMGFTNSGLPPQVDYVPALVNHNITPCPCQGSSDFEYSIGCYDPTVYQVYQCGSTSSTAQASWDNTVSYNELTGGAVSATECLIHATASGPGNGQDTLNYPAYPDGPPEITAQSGPQNGQKVTTSNSIVTIPIVDPAVTNGNAAVTIVGFLQGFIKEVDAGGNVNVTVMNVAGCSSSPTATPPVIGGMGTSPVPVRLITPP